MKKLISGIFIGVFVSLLAFNFTSYAETSSNVIKLIVNGVTLQDELQPISYQNHVYVSAKSLAEALHCDVSWDQANNAVVVNSIKVETTKPVVPDVNIEPVNPIVDDKVKDTVKTDSDKTSVTEPIKVENTNTNPLRLDSIGETTYKTFENSTRKTAYVTVTITNTSNKYIKSIRLKPILNVNDGRSYDSALDDPPGPRQPNGLEGGYFKPCSTVTLTYWALIPNDINIIRWELP